MSNTDPTGTDWSPKEIDLIVADYFDMLRQELANEPYVKAQHNGRLQAKVGRTKGSIEFKHQNISAVLRELGMPWLLGYKPMSNFQKALINGVERFLDLTPESSIRFDEAPSGLAEESSLFFEPAPSLSSSHAAATNPVLQRLISKFDPAERDARNRALGQRGEERVFHHERTRLLRANRSDLARKVRWISQEDGDGAGFDILSFDSTGSERFIEVKTTTGHYATPFFISSNEMAVSKERAGSFRLVRLFDFARAARGFELTPPLENHVLLRPSIYRASFGPSGL